MKKLLLLLAFVSFYTNAQEDATALNFDGINDYVNIGSDNTFNYTTTSTFTIEAWIKPTTTSAPWRVIAARESWNDGEGWIFHLFNNRIYFRTPNAQVFTNEIITNNVWSHVAVTFNTTSIVIFLDGIPVASGNFSLVSSPGQTMHVGARHFNSGNGATDYFGGDMDDLRFWSTARTEMEIRMNKDCALSGSEPGLTAYYKFNQGKDNFDNSSETSLVSANPIYNGVLNNFALNGTTSNYLDGIENGVDNCETLSVASNSLTDSDVILFPNPARDQFTIRNNTSIELENVQIIDINGRLVSNVNLNSGQPNLKIYTSNLRSGLYLVRILSKNTIVTKKLVIK